MFALIENNAVVKHPYSAADLKKANPNTSFPAQISDALMEAYSVFRVFNSTQPELTSTQVLVEENPKFDIEAQRWSQVFSIRDKTSEELQQEALNVQEAVVQATQQRLDNFARTRNYDGILSLCTYATSTVPKFQSEGQYGVEARDATYATLYNLLSEIQAGTRPMPSGFADIEADLPSLEWPTIPSP